ncbi:hypothetical protein ADL27_30950, partial [Streptomyces sp. NRRL F-6602]
MGRRPRRSCRLVLQVLLVLVVAGLLRAERGERRGGGAGAVVAQAMAARGAGAAFAAELRPAAFAGIASDARPLTTLLYLPGITTYTSLAAGMDPQAALAAGLSQMGRMISTQIADAS